MPRTSPVIFWFLLAATLSLDAVSVFWIYSQDLATASVTFYMALAFAQLSALSVWAVLLHQRWSLRWLVPFLTGVVIACTILVAQPRNIRLIEVFYIYTAFMWTHTFFAMLMLWLLQPTSFLQGFAPHVNRRWQYGVAHLLVAMTALAVFLVVLQQAQPLVQERSYVITMCLANTILLLLVLLAAKRLPHWPFRLAISLGAGLAVAALCSYTDYAFATVLNSYAFNSIQAIVLWCWIEVLSASHLSKPELADKPSLQQAER